MNYLLDTNVCVALLRGNRNVQARLKESTPDDCGVSAVTVFELYAGVNRCRQPAEEAFKLGKFLSPLHLLSFDMDAARRTADIRWELEKLGTIIGPYDLQIAGQALTLDVTLVTHNVREFQRVPGLRLVDWEK